MPHARAGANEIYYEVHEGESAPADATPAVLVMGLGSDAHAWEKQLPALTGARRVVVLDNRGVGRSSKPKGPYSTAELAGDVACVLEAAGVERAHVVGMSLGGMIAQELALRYPARVRSLALICTYGRSDGEMYQRAVEGTAAAGAKGRDVAEIMASLARAETAFDFAKAFAFLMKLVFSPAYLAREAAYLQSFYFRSMGYGLSQDGFAGQVSAALAHDTLDRLASLRAPTLVATGTEDALISPRYSAELAQRIASSRLVEIAGGTHGLNFEFEHELNALLRDWLAEQDR
jgi:3-oxoadipate enol-lactonase